MFINRPAAVLASPAVSLPFMDYLHVANIGDRWLIVNVLWELREGETQPPR